MPKGVGDLSDARSLSQRREPEQVRSRAGVDAILRATSELLADSGVDQITMTAIAEQAGLSKAAIYRYFPNKPAVIRALALQVFSEQQERITAALPFVDEPAALVMGGVRAYIEQHRAEPFLVQLRAGIRADPELSRLDLQDSRENAAAIARYLLSVDVGGTKSDVEARVLLILELIESVTRLISVVDEQEGKVIIDNFCDMAEAHMFGRS